MGIMSIAAARKQAGLTQQGLASDLGVSTVTVRNWERGASDIPAKHLRRLAELAGVAETDIFLSKETNIIRLHDGEKKEGV